MNNKDIVESTWPINAVFNHQEEYEAKSVGDVLVKQDCITLSKSLYEDNIEEFLDDIEKTLSFFPTTLETEYSAALQP